MKESTVLLLIIMKDDDIHYLIIPDDNIDTIKSAISIFLGETPIDNYITDFVYNNEYKYGKYGSYFDQINLDKIYFHIEEIKQLTKDFADPCNYDDCDDYN